MVRPRDDERSDVGVCPICKQSVAADQPLFPFCGERCKTIDLGKWLKGDYMISRAIEHSDLDE